MALLGEAGPKRGVLTALNNVTPGTPLWVVTFPTQDLPLDQDFEVWHGFATGPGGYFQVYLGGKGYGVGQNGRVNEYSPSGPCMYVRKGQDIQMHWSIGTGTTPEVTLYLRQPEVGRL